MARALALTPHSLHHATRYTTLLSSAVVLQPCDAGDRLQHARHDRIRVVLDYGHRCAFGHYPPRSYSLTALPYNHFAAQISRIVATTVA